MTARLLKLFALQPEDHRPLILLFASLLATVSVPRSMAGDGPAFDLYLSSEPPYHYADPDSGEVIGQSRESRMSRKWRNPTKVHSPLVWAKSETAAPVTNGNATKSSMAIAAGNTHR